jgi:integrase
MNKLPTLRDAQALAVQLRKRHPNRPLTEAQIRALRHTIDHIRDDALIRLGLSTGLRVSEAVAICTSEIESALGLRVLRQGIGGWTVVVRCVG